MSISRKCYIVALCYELARLNITRTTNTIIPPLKIDREVISFLKNLYI